jgi:hypothetical protein
MTPINPGHALRSLFHGLVEQVFMGELGICSPRLTEYLGDMLVDFVHMDRIFRMRSVDGSTIRDVSRVEAEAFLGPEIDVGTRTRIVNRFIGDFTLFWAGVYPENLRPVRGGGDRLRLYLVQGKRSYGIASELSASDGIPPAGLLRELSAEFECCVHGLSRVRSNWQQFSGPTREN